jgi:hypothetical protein
MPTGWRPADVAEKYPVYKIEDVYHFEKYNTKGSNFFTIWAWIQTIILLIMVSYLFGNISEIKSPGIFFYGAYVFLFVYAYTELMDKNQFAWFWELAKNGVVVYFLIANGDWFGLSKWIPGSNAMIIGYLTLSTIVSFYFLFLEKNSGTVSAE